MFLRIVRQFGEANKELWLFLMMFGIVAMLNYVVASDRMMLGFYVLPTVFSAYHFGRRHATLTALGSILLVILIVHWNPLLFRDQGRVKLVIAEKWYDIAIWGGTLMVTAYAMGTLYEKKEARIQECLESGQRLKLRASEAECAALAHRMGWPPCATWSLRQSSFAAAAKDCWREAACRRWSRKPAW